MKTIYSVITCLFICFGSLVHLPTMARAETPGPVISLTAKDEPLGNVLDTLARDTGYQFNLNRKWKDHPVSAAINRLPLEQGLKRLLRSLNHSLIWEADKTVTIMVFGKADALRPGNAVSFGSPPQAIPEDPEPSADIEETGVEESETPDTGKETPDTETASKDEAGRDEGNAASRQSTGSPDEAPGGVRTTAPFEADQSPSPATTE